MGPDGRNCPAGIIPALYKVIQKAVDFDHGQLYGVSGTRVFQVNLCVRRGSVYL